MTLAWDPSRVDAPIPVVDSLLGLPVLGYHVNVTVPEGGVPEAWAPYRQHPATPERVFAGMEGQMVFLKFASVAEAEAVLAGYVLA
jgi:hypothetical protein